MNILMPVTEEECNLLKIHVAGFIASRDKVQTLEGYDPVFIAAEIEALTSVIDEMNTAISAYEASKRMGFL